MAAYLDPPLQARNGRSLQVLLPRRVSDPRKGKQNEKRSLGAQQDIQMRWLESHNDLPVDITAIAGKGSGEILVREEYQELIREIESQKYDLVLTEDLGRIVRRVHAYTFCELCEDNGVRLIAINNDNVDTARQGWRDAAFFVSYFYEKENADKSQRLKGRLRSIFLNGGALSGLIYGIVKPEKAKNDSELYLDPKAIPIYKEWFRKLDEDGATYAEIADWLNSQGVPVGPGCNDGKIYDGTYVGQVTHNPLLKGIRYWNKRKTRRINSTGKYISEPAPADELLIRHVPHLAVFSEDYYDRVVAKVDARNAKYRRAEPGDDPRRNISRKRTRFPGQSVYCGVCGQLFVFGGHGQKHRLMCNGAREYKCWNAITFDGRKVAARLSDLVFTELERLPAFDADFMQMLQEEAKNLNKRRSGELLQLQEREQGHAQEMSNLLAAIRKRGDSQMLLDELDRLEAEEKSLRYERLALEQTPTSTIEIPTIEEVKSLAREEFSRLAVDSHEFACLMRKLLPQIYVFPFRLCDGGHIGLRASLKFTANALMPEESQGLDGLAARLTSQSIIDLFDLPQRETFRERVVELRTQGTTERRASTDLGITHTAAQRAAALQRKMDSLGIHDPWLPVKSPPDDYSKLRRHRHARYKFEPLEEFPLPWPE